MSVPESTRFRLLGAEPTIREVIRDCRELEKLVKSQAAKLAELEQAIEALKKAQEQ